MLHLIAIASIAYYVLQESARRRRKRKQQKPALTKRRTKKPAPRKPVQQSIQSAPQSPIVQVQAPQLPVPTSTQSLETALSIPAIPPVLKTNAYKDLLKVLPRLLSNGSGPRAPRNSWRKGLGLPSFGL